MTRPPSLRLARRSASAFAAGLALAASRASADGPDAIHTARVALEEQRYDDARALVHDELARPEPARRAPALEITAVAYLLEAKEAEATPFLRALYDLAPAFKLEDPSLPPRVISPFAEEAARPHAAAVAIVARPSQDGADYALEVSRPVDKVSMSCRAGASGAFSAVSLAVPAPRRYRFKLPTAGVYACYALAEVGGLPVGRLGDEAGPVELKPAAPAAKGGLLGEWWFWTIVGAAVTGGAALAIAETRPQEVAQPSALATVTLGPQSR